jgi:hypothetical protein
MENALYDQLANHKDVENCHPVFVARVDGKRCIVASVTDGVVYLTDEGRTLLGAADKPAKASKKVAKKVESANELAPEIDDLDLSE